jgi:hypothetical protein
MQAPASAVAATSGASFDEAVALTKALKPPHIRRAMTEVIPTAKAQRWDPAAPVILAAGVLKLPSLAGPAGAHIHGQILAGFLVAGVAAYLSIRFLTRYFTTRTLTPFAVNCLVAGAVSTVWFAAG